MSNAQDIKKWHTNNLVVSLWISVTNVSCWVHLS